MDLKQSIQEKMPDPKKLDLDRFGAIMDEAITACECGLMIYKDAGSTEWQYKGAGCGAVMDFYIFLNGLTPLYQKMCEEMDRLGRALDRERLAHALCGEMEKALLKGEQE